MFHDKREFYTFIYPYVCAVCTVSFSFVTNLNTSVPKSLLTTLIVIVHVEPWNYVETQPQTTTWFVGWLVEMYAGAKFTHEHECHWTFNIWAMLPFNPSIMFINVQVSSIIDEIFVDCLNFIFRFHLSRCVHVCQNRLEEIFAFANASQFRNYFISIWWKICNSIYFHKHKCTIWRALNARKKPKFKWFYVKK